MSSSSDSEDDLYTNTGSIFGKITEKAKEDIPQVKSQEKIRTIEDDSINLNNSIEIEEDKILEKKRKSEEIEEVIVESRKSKRIKKTINVEKQSYDDVIIDSHNTSLNDSVDVIEEINAALERNRRGRGRRKNLGTTKAAKKKASPKNLRKTPARRDRNRNRQKQSRRGPQVVATIEIDADYPILNSNNFISNIDLGEDISVKVLWKSQLYEKFELRKKEKLDKIFKYYAEKEKVSEELLYFSVNDTVVCKMDTPESLNLNVASIIEGGILSTKTHLSSGYKQNTIELKIQWKNLKRPFIYNMNVTDEMSVLMLVCSKQMNVPLERVRFYFDGEVIEVDDTPSSLELEGGECIDCVEL